MDKDERIEELAKIAYQLLEEYEMWQKMAIRACLNESLFDVDRMDVEYEGWAIAIERLRNPNEKGEQDV